MINSLPELFLGQKEILYAMLFRASWRSGGTGYREIQIQFRVLLHQPLYDG